MAVLDSTCYVSTKAAFCVTLKNSRMTRDKRIAGWTSFQYHRHSATSKDASQNDMQAYVRLFQERFAAVNND